MKKFLALILLSACVGSPDDATNEPESDLTSIETETEAVGTDDQAPPVECSSDCVECRGSPLIIDLDRGGSIDLVGYQNGVNFNIDADGTSPKIGWTQPGVFDGFLALDRNGNGKIDDGSELFGTAAPQWAETPSRVNGFRALSMYDTNGDGWIDWQDDVWGGLMVWIDRNHDGASPQYGTAANTGSSQELWYLKDWVIYPPNDIPGMNFDYVAIPSAIQVGGYTNAGNWTDVNGNRFWFHNKIKWMVGHNHYTSLRWDAQKGWVGNGTPTYVVEYPLDNVWDVYFTKQGGTNVGGNFYSIYTLPGVCTPAAIVYNWAALTFNKPIVSAGCRRDFYVRPQDPNNPYQRAVCSGQIDPQTGGYPVAYKPYASPHNPNVYAFSYIIAIAPTSPIQTMAQAIQFMTHGNQFWLRWKIGQPDSFPHFWFTGDIDPTKPTLSQYCYLVDPADFNHFYVPTGTGAPPSYTFLDNRCSYSAGVTPNDARSNVTGDLDLFPVTWPIN